MGREAITREQGRPAQNIISLEWLRADAFTRVNKECNQDTCFLGPLHTAFLHHRLQVPVAQGVAAAPAHIQQDDFGQKVPLLKQSRSRQRKARRSVSSCLPYHSLVFATQLQSLQVPLVEVWLALLLGDSGYQLTRPAYGELADFAAWSEAFYSGT